MAKDDVIEIEGIVTDALPNAMFKVDIGNGHTILAHISELAGNVCQNGVSVANVNFEHSIRQCISYDALNLDYVVLCQDVNLPGLCLAFVRRESGTLRNSSLSTLPHG